MLQKGLEQFNALVIPYIPAIVRVAMGMLFIGIAANLKRDMENLPTNSDQGIVIGGFASFIPLTHMLIEIFCIPKEIGDWYNILLRDKLSSTSYSNFELGCLACSLTVIAMDVGYFIGEKFDALAIPEQVIEGRVFDRKGG